MQTRAAYACGASPAVLRVTNRNDSGAGSLRAALTASGPRVVLFEVSGYIDLTTEVYITNDCMTVAGQTAPAPGITIRSANQGTFHASNNNGGFYVDADNILFQHLRVRMGRTCNTNFGIGYFGGASNIVFDHMSISWGQDDNIIMHTSVSNIAVWRSILSEGLKNTPGADDGSHYGPCSGGLPSNGHGLALSGENSSVIQSLFAHNLERNPQSWSGTRGYIANNVVYNGHDGMVATGIQGQGYKSMLISIINNHFKRGPTSRDDYGLIMVDLLAGTDRIYWSGNTFDDGGLSPAIKQIQLNSGSDVRQGTPPLTAPAGYTPMSAGETYTSVLKNAGARPANRDVLDIRTLASVQDRTGDIISHPDAVGGYPALATNTWSVPLPASPHTVQASGYTNLEVWLHAHAAAVEGGTTVPIVPVPTGFKLITQ